MPSWDIELCGEPLLVGKDHLLGKCLKDLAIMCPTFLLLTITSVYYIGKQQRPLYRLHHQLIPIYSRIAVVTVLLICPILKLLCLYTLVDSQFYMIDYVVVFIESFCWLTHLRYLWVLRKSITVHTRGPPIVLFAFVLCVAAAVYNLNLAIRRALGNANYQEQIEKYVAVVVVIALVLYSFTLLPRGREHEWQYEELWTIDSTHHEREPLVGSLSSTYGGFHEDTDPYALGTAEEDTHFVSKLFLWWLQPLMKKGYSNLLQATDDLFDLPISMRASTLDSIFALTKKSSSTGHSTPEQCAQHFDAAFSDSPSLLQTFHQCFGLEYYSIGLLKLLSDALTFAGPLLLNLLVTFLETDNKVENENGYYYVIGLFGSTLVGALCSTHYGYLVNKMGLKVRAALITTIYKKTLGVSKITLSLYNTGEIVNFMSTDTDRIVNFCQSFHQFWSLPVQIIFTLYLLHKQVGFSFLVGLVFAILLIPLNHCIAKKIGIYSKLMMEEKDKRIQLVNEILNGIRVVKMHAWEEMFTIKVDRIRQKEIKFLKKRKYLDAFCVYFWATTPVVISFLTFTTYVLLGNVLSASKIFTSIALFNMLIVPLNAFPWVLNGLMEAWISLKRVEGFLKLPDLNLNLYYSQPKQGVKLEICDGVFKYTAAKTAEFPNDKTNEGHSSFASSEDHSFHLGPLNMELIQGKFVCIVGKVGSGKSTLLYSILADINRVNGSVHLSNMDKEQGIGFVPQEPWVQQTSVKENILFGKTLNSVKYRSVLEACALFDDLKILPFGDRTEVGEKGITLSGGQRSRIALARVVYQDVEIYLLDDPLSAVDVHIAEHIFSNCIMGLLKNKTRIMCTHSSQFIEKADTVIMLKDGRVFLQGLPSRALQIYPIASKKGSVEDSSEIEPIGATVESPPLSEENEPIDRLVEEEERSTGMVKFHVYKSYWNAIGNALAVIVLLSCLFMQASRTVSDWWLSFWISNVSDQTNGTLPNGTHFIITQHESRSDNENYNITFYLAVYGGLAAANNLFTIVRAFSYAFCGIKAAVTLHSKLLENIIKAPICFFDVTPLGRILNRFSSDVYNIDDSLPFMLNILLAQTFSLIGCLAVTCYSLPWIAILVIPLGAVYYKLQRYYRYTSRELKRLSSVTLSPIYANFTETLNGHSTIRALASTARFQRNNIEKLDANQQAMFATMAASQWLNLRLQFIGVVVVTGVALIALLQNEFTPVDPGLVGLALSYALSITSLLNGAVTAFAETEKEIVSVERVVQYIKGVKAETELGSLQPPFAWPSHGVITFQDVALRYRPQCPYALKNITFETKPAEKLGIVGRTGSGKSSMIQAIFRMVNINQGEILIDGVNISNLSLQKLRSHLSVIPQDPFLFCGTIRENLDPNHFHNDAELWRALANCHIEKKIRSLGGLETGIEDRGRNFSSGERQLFCLARTLLYKAKILCMDEATASIDRQTDSLIQLTIRMAFRHTTILMIAHRVETVLDCDRVMVMGGGQILEMDKPSILLANTNSEFYKLVYNIK